METFNTTIFPKGEKAPSEYFSGGTAWVKILKPNTDELNCQIGNVIFEPRCRNNWHSHGGGQILIVTSGTGFYQEKGKSAQVLKAGDVVNIPPHIVHWHGASRDSEFTHIAINPNTQNGIVEWMEPVTDEEYNNL
ncbi:cupin domain-containing protein [Chryseobacterium sp. G0201]|uniref:cupin domain-containing protein n=1 Tax=Chryseobacterium sp. G0201 TaxID=2487065 RepID=UPI000F4D36BA|nr:cupin domain-containing protein [Chryseobacterium sp. G0201]AZA52192.1 cupin domain-containing protein [Chryseobacterium sp. G0201]